jgi:hypothetical protein
MTTMTLMSVTADRNLIQEGVLKRGLRRIVCQPEKEEG